MTVLPLLDVQFMKLKKKNDEQKNSEKAVGVSVTLVQWWISSLWWKEFVEVTVLLFYPFHVFRF